MSHYLIDIIILLMAAVVVVPFSQFLKLGAVPGFLIAGVIVGPSGFSLISNIVEIGNLAEIGVVLLLFVIGIELKPSLLWQIRVLVFGLGGLQVLITGILLGSIGHYFFDIPLRAAMIVGPALALSSTAFVLQLLTEQKSLTSAYGRTSFAILLLQDLAVVPLLALVPLLAVPELSLGEDIGLALIESIFILGLVILIGRYFLHPIFHRVSLSGNPEVFTASAILIVLGAAVATEYAGLSMAMGAFLVGLLISDSSYRDQVKAEIQPFRGLFLGLFFMSMGMSLDLNLFLENPLVSFAIVGLLIIIKAITLFSIAYWFKIKTKNNIAVSLVLAQSGEFALVLFSLSFQAEILSEVLFQQLILVVLLSMILTPLLAYFSQWIIRSQNTKNNKNVEIPVEEPIVLIGYGRVGHRIGEILSIANKSFVAIDSNALVVEKERAKGHHVFYGDARNSEVLKAACVKNPKIIVVTLNDSESTKEVISTLRYIYPDIIIYARGHSLNQCRELRKLGVSSAVSESLEASLELSRMILMNVGVNNKKRESIIGGFRQKYHDQIVDEIKLSVSTDTK